MEPRTARPRNVSTRLLRAVAPLRVSTEAPEKEPAAPAAQRTPRTTPRSEAERVLLAVLLLSLGLTLGAFLTADAVSRLDALFAAVILLSGLALLVLMELSRTGGAPPGSDDRT